MIYILDAYNVIHKIQTLERTLDQNLRSARDGLVTLCQRTVTERGDISKIILVFDGKSEFNDLPQTSVPKIELVFSETNEDADERIATILEKLAKIRNKMVVSDDNFVRNHARAYEARVMSVSEFEQLTRPKRNQRNKLDPPEKSFLLPSNIADEITKAYKKKLGLD